MKRMLDQKTIDELQALIDNGATSGLEWVNAIKNYLKYWENDGFIEIVNGDYAFRVSDDGFYLEFGDNEVEIILGVDNLPTFNNHPLGTKFYIHKITDSSHNVLQFLSTSPTAYTDADDLSLDFGATKIITPHIYVDDEGFDVCCLRLMNTNFNVRAEYYDPANAEWGNIDFVLANCTYEITSL